MPKLVLAAFVALVTAVGAGWFWGSAGRWDRDSALRTVELRSDLVEARSSVLDARLDLYNVNFGNASRHLEDTKGPLRRATDRLRAGGRENDARRLDPALARIDEAQQLANRLDQGANARAADAAQTISAFIATVGTP